METALPFISVIVPVFNGADTIIQCVDALLVQDYPADCLEILVVDNASKDQTLSLLQSYAHHRHFKLIRETTILNAYGARNTGIAAASGEILAFTDADCVATTTWLRELVKGWEDARVGTFIGEILPLDPQTVVEKYRGVNFWTQHKDDGKAIPGCRTANCAFRRAMLDEIGVFDASTTSAADAELLVRGYHRQWKHVVNYSAVVYHKNCSTVRALWRQSMRYGGGHKWRASLGVKELVYWAKPPTFRRTLRRDLVHVGSFARRASLHIFRKTPDKAEARLYVVTPLLQIVEDTASYIGYLRGPVTR